MRTDIDEELVSRDYREGLRLEKSWVCRAKGVDEYFRRDWIGRGCIVWR